MGCRGLPSSLNVLRFAGRAVRGIFFGYTRAGVWVPMSDGEWRLRQRLGAWADPRVAFFVLLRAETGGRQ